MRSPKPTSSNNPQQHSFLTNLNKDNTHFYYVVLILIFDAMKAFALFMTFLMFFAGFDLCKENESDDCNSNTIFNKVSSDAQSQETPCTPFCNCARCPFSVVVTEIANMLLKGNSGILKFALPPNQETIEVKTSIWQPPKFS